MKKLLSILSVFMIILTLTSCEKEVKVKKYYNQVTYEEFNEKYLDSLNKSILKDYHVKDFVQTTYNYKHQENISIDDTSGEKITAIIDSKSFVKNEYDKDNNIIRTEYETYSLHKDIANDKEYEDKYEVLEEYYIYSNDNGFAVIYDCMKEESNVDYNTFEYYLMQSKNAFVEYHTKTLLYGPIEYYVDRNTYTIVFDNDTLEIYQLTFNDTEVKCIKVIENSIMTEKQECILTLSNVNIDKDFE